MMSEPRPSSPQSRTGTGGPPSPRGQSRGVRGIETNLDADDPYLLGMGLRKVHPDRLLPSNRGFQPSLAENFLFRWSVVAGFVRWRPGGPAITTLPSTIVAKVQDQRNVRIEFRARDTTRRQP